MMYPHKPPGPRVPVRGERGILDDRWEYDTSNHEVATGHPSRDYRPLGVASKLPHSTPPHGLVKTVLVC
jgi:hypothetical protein